MKKIITILTILITFLTQANSQSPDLIWAKTLGDVSAFNQSLDCALDNSGNIFVIGYTTMWPDGDYLILKYNTSNGDTIWTKTFNGNPLNPSNDNDIAMGCIVDGSGNLYVTGMSSNSAGNFDILTIKYNGLSGDTIWTRRFNGAANGYDAGTKCALDGSGNLYVTGLSFTGAYTDFCMLKYNTVNGNLIWSKNYPSPLGNKGESYGCSLNGSNIFINGYIYSGTTYKLYTLKCNTNNGDTIWTKINNEGLDSLQFIHSGCVADNSGNVYIVGNCSNFTKGVYARIIKYDAFGNVNWSEIYENKVDDTLNDALYSCTLDNTGNLIATGTNNGPSTFLNTLLTLKYNPATGDTLWTKTYGGGSGVNCTVDALGYIYVTGVPDYWGCLILKYDKSGVVGINENKEKKGFSVYPNPFSTETTVQSSYHLKDATLTVYNSNGQAVIQINNISGQSITLHRNNLPNGLYFLRLTQNNKEIATNKLIITN